MEINLKELAESIKSGNEEAFRQFFDIYFPKVYRFLLAMLRSSDDAEDVTSIAFIYVWDNREKLRDSEQLVAWLYQIARHRALDYIRKNKSSRTLSLEGFEEFLPDGKSSLDVLTDHYYTSQYVEGLLSKLSESERAVVYLRFGEGLSFNEIAQRLGMASIAVRVRMHRIIKKLQKRIDDDGEASFQHRPKEIT